MIAPSIGRKIGKKGALLFGWALNATAGVLIWLFALNKDGSANLIIMTLAMCMKQSANYFYMVFTANYYLDCGEYGYYTSGIDNRTMAVTVMNWPTKIGFALGGSLVGYGLAWAGYHAPADGAAAYFESTSRFMMVLGLIPALCCIVGAVVILLFYKLTDAQAAEYAKLNAEREKA